MPLKNYFDTMFIQPVREFREATGLPVGSVVVDHALHLHLFNEEALEFIMATELADKADAIADMIVIGCDYWLDAGTRMKFNIFQVLQGLEDAAARLGINAIGAFSLVHDSNMSKVCNTHQANLTHTKFRELGIFTIAKQVPGGLWAIYSDTDDTTYPRGKLLKPVSYFKPKWQGNERLWCSETKPFTEEQLQVAVAGVEAVRRDLDPEVFLGADSEGGSHD